MNLKWSLLNLLILSYFSVSVISKCPDDISKTQAVEKFSKKGNKIAEEKERHEPDNSTEDGPENYDPMLSNIAPRRGQRGYPEAPYIITESRLREIRNHFMYPYSDKGGDGNEGDLQKQIQSSAPQIHENLYFGLPFFGFRYNYTRVSLNGYLEFSDPPETYDYPLVFPVKDWPKQNDPSFIGIFYSKCTVGKLRNEEQDRRSPGVYFGIERDLGIRRDQKGVELRERLKWDIREGIIGSETFSPKHAIIVTWKNVSFDGGIPSSLYHTNTFQIVLATDEVHTYAMFNYLNIDWYSHTDAGGDVQRGEGGVPAFVGFNAGNGSRSYEYFPYSQSSQIGDLTISGYANGFKGRHLFRIDENIFMGTCQKYLDGSSLPLSFSPESGNMLGGTMVNITGPCFSLSDEVKCTFGNSDVVTGYVVDRNRAICIQPQLFVEGYVRFQVAIGPNRFKWRGQYYVESPSTASKKIYFKDMQYHEKSPSEISITWERYNLTTNQNANVRVSLWGYSESNSEPNFSHIIDLASKITNTGEYTIIPSQYRTLSNKSRTDIKVGFIQISLAEPIKVYTSANSQQIIDITPVLWSRPIPLGWYFQYQWESMYGENWPKNVCDDWLLIDRSLNNFTQKLPQCPCTVQQALADKGQYMPDFECDKDSNRECIYNKQALHCVKTGSPNSEGAEQQCCYDRLGYLMLSQDQQWGSSPRRSHSLGVTPYNEDAKVPTLSQWFNDILPKYFCCMWQDEQAVGCETLRSERRPTQDCVDYEGPGIAGVYGDPHIVTFDDVEYTFNGKGEFVLVKSSTNVDNLEVQGRFEQMNNNSYGEVKATRLTSVVARVNSSSIIEVKRRPLDATWRYRLDVFANGKRIYFDKLSMKVQHFSGVTVYTPTYIKNQSEVIMMFDNGAGVEVVDNLGYMTARVYLPKSLLNKTTGLFGNWNFNKEDDFTLPNGTKTGIVPNINNMERIYNDFGSLWMIDDLLDEFKGRSLFFKDYGHTSSYYNSKSFIPQFLMTPEDIIPANRTNQIDQTYQICSTEMYECYYDYAMTLDKSLTNLTKKDKDTIYSLKQTARTKVISCGVLETPRFGSKSTFLFVPGTKVIFTCDEGFVLNGDSRRTCQVDGTWDIPYFGFTKCEYL